MRDELYDRDYQAGRDALNDGIDHLIGAFMSGIRALNDVQFRAPWKAGKDRPTGLA